MGSITAGMIWVIVFYRGTIDCKCTVTKDKPCYSTFYILTFKRGSSLLSFDPHMQNMEVNQTQVLLFVFGAPTAWNSIPSWRGCTDIKNKRNLWKQSFVKTKKTLLRSRERQMKENHPSQQEEERSSPAAGENDYYRSNTTDETSPQRGSHRRAEICKCDGTNVRLRKEYNLSNMVCF